MSSPWDFGWTQVLTIIGFAITGTIAIAGFRSFDRWKREKLEEKRIEIALEALSLAYEGREVFEVIRNPGSYGHEWADMPGKDKMTGQDWNHRGPFYAITKRVQDQSSFFDRVAKIRRAFSPCSAPRMRNASNSSEKPGLTSSSRPRPCAFRLSTTSRLPPCRRWNAIFGRGLAKATGLRIVSAKKSTSLYAD